MAPPSLDLNLHEYYMTYMYIQGITWYVHVYLTFMFIMVVLNVPMYTHIPVVTGVPYILSSLATQTTTSCRLCMGHTYTQCWTTPSPPTQCGATLPGFTPWPAPWCRSMNRYVHVHVYSYFTCSIVSLIHLLHHSPLFMFLGA